MRSRRTTPPTIKNRVVELETHLADLTHKFRVLLDDLHKSSNPPSTAQQESALLRSQYSAVLYTELWNRHLVHLNRLLNDVFQNQYRTDQQQLGLLLAAYKAELLQVREQLLKLHTASLQDQTPES